MSDWKRNARPEKLVVSKHRQRPLDNKPHIYLHCYPSGLKFWRARKPIRYANTRCSPLLAMQAAYKFVQRLNTQRGLQP